LHSTIFFANAFDAFAFNEKNGASETPAHTFARGFTVPVFRMRDLSRMLYLKMGALQRQCFLARGCKAPNFRTRSFTSSAFNGNLVGDTGFEPVTPCV